MTEEDNRFTAPVGNVEWRVYLVDQAVHYLPTGAIVRGHTYFEAHHTAAKLIGEPNLGNVKLEMVGGNDPEPAKGKADIQAVVAYFQVTFQVSYLSKGILHKGQKERIASEIANAANEALDMSPYFRDKPQVDYSIVIATFDDVKRGRTKKHG